jgi:hypothetical protein
MSSEILHSYELWITFLIVRPVLLIVRPVLLIVRPVLLIVRPVLLIVRGEKSFKIKALVGL